MELVEDSIEYAVGILLVISAVLFAVAAFIRRRPQKTGFVVGLLTLPLFVIYYADLPVWSKWLLPDGFAQNPESGANVGLRTAVAPLDSLPWGEANIQFESRIAPAAIIGGLMLIRVLVFQRVAVRNRLQRVGDPIANFFAGATFITMFGAILVTTYHWGWQGSLIIGAISTLVYLGALALLMAFAEIIVEVSKLIGVWLKRKLYLIATWVTRAASWVSSLGGRLVSRRLIEQIQRETEAQRQTFGTERVSQDDLLVDGYVKDRNRRRAARQKAAARTAAARAAAGAAPAPAVTAAPAPAAVTAAPEPVATVTSTVVETPES